MERRVMERRAAWSAGVSPAGPAGVSPAPGL